MNTISIIGCGWLGLPLAKRLVADGLLLRGSTRSSEKLPILAAAGIEGFLLDLASDAQVDPALFDCDALFLNIPPGRHAGLEHRYPAQIEKGLAHLSPRCRRVVFVSSTSVYPACNRSVSETFVGEPDKASGRALCEAEAVVQAEGREVVILRMAGLIGPERMPGNFLAGKTDVQHGDCPVNLLHQADAITASIAALTTSLPVGVYNVVCDEHPTRRDYYQRSAQELGLTSPSFAEDAEPRWKIVDNTKIKQCTSMQFRSLDVI